MAELVAVFIIIIILRYGFSIVLVLLDVSFSTAANKYRYNKWKEQTAYEEEEKRRNREQSKNRYQGKERTQAGNYVCVGLKGKYFSNCHSAAEARQVFVSLMKQYHPDVGGDPAVAQEIIAEYEDVKRSW